MVRCFFKSFPLTELAKAEEELQNFLKEVTSLPSFGNHFVMDTVTQLCTERHPQLPETVVFISSIPKYFKNYGPHHKKEEGPAKINYTKFSDYNL